MAGSELQKSYVSCAERPRTLSVCRSQRRCFRNDKACILTCSNGHLPCLILLPLVHEAGVTLNENSAQMRNETCEPGTKILSSVRLLNNAFISKQPFPRSCLLLVSISLNHFSFHLVQNLKMHTQGFNDVLVGIPSDISASILLTWLNIRNILAVDEAYCNREKRTHLMSLFSSDRFVLPQTRLDMNYKGVYLDWITSRGVCVDCVDVFHCDVEPHVLAYILNVAKRVRKLSFSWTNFEISTNASNFVEILRECTNLELLKLEECTINSTVVEAILQCVSLRDLRMCSCEEERSEQLAEASFGELYLTTLVITGGFFSAPVFWMNTCPHDLRVLGLTLTSEFTSALITEKFAMCTKLHGLSISCDSSAMIVSGQFAMLLRLCPDIEHLELSATHLEPYFAADLAESVQNLKTLCLKECLFCDDVFAQLVDYGNDQLEALYLTRCAGSFTREGLSSILENCTSIRTLFIVNWDRHDRDFFDDFDVDLLDNLTSLHLSPDPDLNCRNVVNYSAYISSRWNHSRLKRLENPEVFPNLEVLHVCYIATYDFKDMMVARPGVKICKVTFMAYDFYDLACDIVN